MSSIRIG
jgi:hypothetical protein